MVPSFVLTNLIAGYLYLSSLSLNFKLDAHGMRPVRFLGALHLIS